MGWLQSSLGLDVTGEWGQVININVGGVHYTCFRKTFLDYQDNAIFTQVVKDTGKRSEDGSLVIDRDGTTFRHVLNFMRLKALLLPDDFDEWDLLLDDSRYYEIKPLEEAILGSFAYRHRLFRKNLPSAVLLHVNGTVGSPSVSVTPELPALTIVNQVLHFQGSPLPTVDQAVLTILSSYGYGVEHWKTDGLEHRVFFSLSSSLK